MLYFPLLGLRILFTHVVQGRQAAKLGDRPPSFTLVYGFRVGVQSFRVWGLEWQIYEVSGIRLTKNNQKIPAFQCWVEIF